MDFWDLGDMEVNFGREAICFVNADYGLITLFGFGFSCFSYYATFYYCFSFSIFTLFPGLFSNFPSNTYAD
jgi:hypothetical protein